MGIFFVYILKSSVCLAVFYLFYRLLEGALITTFLAPRVSMLLVLFPLL